MDKENIEEDDIVNFTILIEFTKNIKEFLSALNSTFYDKINDTILNDEQYNYIYNYNSEINVDCFKDEKLFQYITTLFDYTIKTFPNKFFDILYQNEEIFSQPLYLLPKINFSYLFHDNISETTKESLWKYMQIILFTIITSIKDKHSFGDTEKLFQAINPEELKNKLESTMNDIQELFKNFDDSSPSNNYSDNSYSFEYSENYSENYPETYNNKFKEFFKNIDQSNNFDFSNSNFSNIFSSIFDNLDLSNLDLSNLDLSNLDLSNLQMPNLDMSNLDISNLDISNLDMSNLFNNFFNNIKNSTNFKNKKDNSNNKFNNLPDFNNVHDHINKLINGKIGNLAKELAEETAEEMKVDLENVENISDVFNTLFKNPNKLMSLVNNIGSKIDSKMKDGSIKESELLEEAGDLLKNMTNIPGMDNFGDILKTMNLDKMMPKNGKINKNAFENMMNQNVKMSKMKERMREKLNKNNDQKNNPDSLESINNNLKNLQEEMLNNNNNDFLNDILKKQNLNNNNESRPVNNKPKKNNKKKSKK